MILAIYLSLNLYIYFKKQKEINSFILKSLPVFILEELLFITGFFFWTFVRAHQSDLNGLEKFMDYGFINSILNSKFLPPVDMWFAGKPINYYWFGHFVTAVITKLSGIPSGVGYNLMLGTILGLSLSASFSLVSSLIHVTEKLKRLAVIGGLISAIILNFGGNFHSTYYILKDGAEKYWYPDATRFIGYNPDTNDKTIHEFPIYSYVVSDLHAHLLNFPFVLLYISLLYSFIDQKVEVLKKRNGTGFKNFIGHWLLIIGHPQNKILILLGLVLGVMFMTNAWDFANYLLASGFVILLTSVKKFGFKLDSLYKIALPILVIISVSVITVLPFVLNFESIADGVSITHTKSPLWQLAILWGFPAVLTLVFIVLRKKYSREDIFTTSLIITSWILIFLPEFIYVKDIYTASHYRANTMFKLTYQAYVMFYLLSGYIAVRSIRSLSGTLQRLILTGFFIVLFASILYYPIIATRSYYGNLKGPTKSLSGETWLMEKNPDIYSAILWFRKNVSGQPVILEAPGDSYTEYNSISAYTGFPTISGWFVHEWLWRGSSEVPQARVSDIVQIYTAESIPLTKSLLQKYKVEYVIVGDYEREKYSNLIEEKFQKLGKAVFTSPTTKIYEIK